MAATQRADPARPLAGRIVFFDIGNCLYDPYRTFQRAMDAIGRGDLTTPILERFGCYPDQPGHNDGLLTAFGLAAADVQAYYDHFFQHPVFHEGVPGVLDRLRARGAHLGVISDGHFATQVRKLALWGLAPRLCSDLIFIGSTPATGGRVPGSYPEGVQLAGSKRDRETFDAVLARVRQRYGRPPAACTMVGDDYTRDALHPSLAGMHGVWFVPNEPAARTLPAGADPGSVPRIESLSLLEEIVAREKGGST